MAVSGLVLVHDGASYAYVCAFAFFSPLRVLVLVLLRAHLLVPGLAIQPLVLVQEPALRVQVPLLLGLVQVAKLLGQVILLVEVTKGQVAGLVVVPELEVCLLVQVVMLVFAQVN